MAHKNLQSGLSRNLGPILNDQRVRGAVYQAFSIGLVVIAMWWIIDNTATNLSHLNTVSGYGFLDGRAGFEISQKLIGYSSDSSYARALLVGFLNTVLVAATGIVTATVVGFLIALGRLSSNWLVSRLCTIYVELFRNTPALLVIFFWYSGVLTLLPQPRDSLALPFGALLNNRGMVVPSPIWSDGYGVVFAALLLSIGLVVILKFWSTRRQALTGRRFPVLSTSVTLLVALPVATIVGAGAPFTFDVPVATRFNVTGGSTLAPEFVALYLALSLYTAAFIAEIIRAGMQGVAKGQSEAAHALGLRHGTTKRLVVVPQALRIIIPPLTSQYLNLTKNSSLGVAIGFPELISTGGTIMNQTGRAIEIVSIWLIVFLATSLATSVCMNLFNRKMALVER